MQVQSIMRRNVVTVRPEDSLALALQQMLWAGVRHLPVLDGDELVGVMTERDLLRFRAEHPRDAMSHVVADAMTRTLHSVDPEESVDVAGRRMADERVGCLPVRKRGRLLGMITTADVLLHGARQLFAGSPTSVTAAQVMTKEPVSVRPRETLGHAVYLFVEHRMRHLPVVDERGRVLGLLEDRFIRPEPGSDWSRVAVSSLMDPDPVSVGPNTSLGELRGMFVNARLAAVLVVNDSNELMGIISYVDLLRQEMS